MNDQALSRGVPDEVGGIFTLSKSQGFTHFSDDGHPIMVNVSDKEVTNRVAIAQTIVKMQVTTRDAIVQQQVRKGDVLSVAELAGIMAAKRTSELIPLCHQVPLHHVAVRLSMADDLDADGLASLVIQATVETAYQTGVEMESLTACSVAALTVYDMCKALDRGMRVEDTRLIYKAGGKSGTYQSE